MWNFRVCTGNCKLEPARGHHAWFLCCRASCSRLLNHTGCCASTQRSCRAARKSSWRERETSQCGRSQGALASWEPVICLCGKMGPSRHVPKDGTHGGGLGVLPAVHPQELEKVGPRVDGFTSCDHPDKRKPTKGTQRNSRPRLLIRNPAYKS